MKTVLRLLLPVFCLMLLTACGGKQVPTREGDLPPWMGTLADLRQFPQDLNVYAKAAGPDKALLDAEEQAAQDARFIIGRAVVTSITPGAELKNLYRPMTFADRLRTLSTLAGSRREPY